MVVARNYSNVSVATTLPVGITSGSATFDVASASGYPTTPFTAVLDKGTAAEEVILVTNVAGTSPATVTATRGYDGSTAKSHSANATLQHYAIGQDYRDTQTHIAASAGVHGRTGDLVGTTDAQTVSGKTLSSSTLSGDTAVSTASTPGLKVQKGGAGFTPDLLLLTLEDGTTMVAKVTAAGDATVHNLTATGTAAVTGTVTATGKVSANGGEDVAGKLTVTQATLDALAIEVVHNDSQANPVWQARKASGGANASIGPLGATFATLSLTGFFTGDLVNCVSGLFRVDSAGNAFANNGIGRIGLAEADTGTTATSSGTTETFDPNLYTATLSLVSGRRYEVEAYVRVDTSVAPQPFSIRIRSSGTTSNPTAVSTLVAEAQDHCDIAAGSGQRTILCKGTFVAGATGSTKMGLSVTRTGGGTGDLTLRAPATNRYLIVRDLGVG
jgi:hypothetical protein